MQKVTRRPNKDAALLQFDL